MLQAQINETDRNDARGIAQMMRAGLIAGACEDVTQSEAAHAADHRKLLQGKAIAIENDLRGTCVTSVSRSGQSGS